MARYKTLVSNSSVICVLCLEAAPSSNTGDAGNTPGSDCKNLTVPSTYLTLLVFPFITSHSLNFKKSGYTLKIISDVILS